MFEIQFIWLAVAMVSAAAGLVGIVCFRCGRAPGLSCWGRRLFLLTLFVSGAGSLAVADKAQLSLPYLGLAFAGLVIALVWEVPKERSPQRVLFQ